MANTVIQIKRSSSTATPTNGSLAAAEPAYSFNSDKLFIGNTAGTGVIEIGGKYWVDTTVAAFQQANAAPGIANSYATAVGAAGNNYTVAVGAAGNAYTQVIGTAGNNYTNAVGGAGNAYINAVGTAGNNYSVSVGAAANAWSNTINSFATSTFVRLTSPSQTITGNLSIVGSLTISGNTTIINAENLRVTDPLIYLAGNNYLSDIVDIGFIANYVNATGSNVHTGLYREHVDKQYYLFQGYDAEPANNHIGAFSNNMTLAVLNADLRTSNLTLGGANAILLIASAFDKANAANVLAFETGIGANAWANALSVSSNAYATAIGAAGNNYTNAVGTAGNNYTLAIGAEANNWANTISSTRALSSNAYAEAIGAAANTASRDASRINTGLLTVPFGGTAMTSFTQNGVLFGNTAGALKVTSAGTEGQVLQASSTGIPQFAMLDGGGF